MDLIDVHSHIVPERFPDNPSPATNSRWPCMHVRAPDDATVMIADKPFRVIDSRSWDVARRIADMDRDGVTMQALSPMPELLSYWFTPADGLEMSRWMNHSIAAMVAAAPARFAGLGTVPLQDPALAATELARLQRDGLRGVELGSNINGVVLGDRRFDEFYAEAQRLDLALFVHALHPIGADRLAGISRSGTVCCLSARYRAVGDLNDPRGRTRTVSGVCGSASVTAAARSSR